MESEKSFHDLPEPDLSIIKSHDWAENMWRRLNVGFQKNFVAWITVILRLSNNKEDVNGWVKTYEEHYENTCCELVTDIEQLRSSVVEKIEESLKKIQQHCKILRIKMPEFGNENLGLFQEYQLLQKCIDKYEVMIMAKRSELDALRHKQSELCQCLGKEPKMIPDEPLPSPEELDCFKKRVETLEDEKFSRMETFVKIKQEIIDIIAELKYKPSSRFEESVINCDDFRVTDENMKLLSSFRENLKEQQKNVKEEIARLWHKIENLWNILDIYLSEREHFRQSTIETSSVLETLKKELSRCEDLKKANIKTFIHKFRGELNALWEKSHCKKGEGIENFGFYVSDCYTEDLLQLYELEVEKWSRYYEENREIIQLLNKHNLLWLKMKELEKMAANPSRFHNRGGKLLKEEKERNMLSKKIPAIEDNLISLADTYEKRYGKPFRTFGLTVLEYFENLHVDRENTKQQQSNSRKLLNTPSTSTMKIITPKRKKTPSTPKDIQKRVKLTPREVTTEPKKTFSIPKITVTTTTLTKRRSMEKKQRIEKRRRSARQLKLKMNERNTTTTEYREFQNELSERSVSRSTLYPSATPSFMSSITPKKLIPRTPSNIKTTPSSYRTPNNKLTITKSNLKLVF